MIDDARVHPGLKHTGTASKPLSHAVCRVCVPHWPVPGDKALCGHLVDVNAAMALIHCVVCLDLMQPHIDEHIARGEYPR
jgi:hypothetical protein